MSEVARIVSVLELMGRRGFVSGHLDIGGLLLALNIKHDMELYDAMFVFLTALMRHNIEIQDKLAVAGETLVAKLENTTSHLEQHDEG